MGLFQYDFAPRIQAVTNYSGTLGATWKPKPGTGRRITPPIPTEDYIEERRDINGKDFSYWRGSYISLTMAFQAFEGKIPADSGYTDLITVLSQGQYFKVSLDDGTTWTEMRRPDGGFQLELVKDKAIGVAMELTLTTREPLPGQYGPSDRKIG